ncbi:phytanoyl-CoA dioxygenase family protein [Psychroserpens luteolus]|uniref:phytanoyl-CoA dioxygenase family protein n=1 Tax=Psychroserpens luteolus TaxID=2855840 RepID=UPI001E524509|nr:phytanoyl-CoA dioxygenase family protein [Psychroserpens luteolus]MCD2260920.1 phytanoyl-CoA dioxygenase family protein [Psychroserpens luteolus]
MIKKHISMAKEQEQGKLGIAYLKTIWTSIMLQKEGVVNESIQLKHNYVTAVFDALGIGLEPTYKYVFESSPSFEQFEDWVIRNGIVSQEMINLFNLAISSSNQKSQDLTTENNVLDKKALDHWDKEGYIIIPNAITEDDIEASLDVIYTHLQIDPNDTSTWYEDHPLKQGIMVQLFRHPQLDKNRFSKKIQQAYQQLWQRTDLIVSNDRVSFNPPETDNYKFPGPNLHWDVSLKRPIPFGLQGLLYLTDTPENQGAFTLVPGFHRKIDSWLENLPHTVNPRTYDFQLLGTKPIAAKAGDFIIWNQMLPHGSSPNTGMKPRVVQYINYQPIHREIETEWI